MTTSHGDRGEAWVAAQLGVMVLAVAAPGWEGIWPPMVRRLGRVTGLPVALAGTFGASLGD